MVLTTSLKISTLPLTKWSYTNYPPKNDYSHIQNYSPFLSRVTKRVRVPSRHLIYIERASISIIIIILGISSIIIISIISTVGVITLICRDHRSGRHGVTAHLSLVLSITANTGVHLTQLITESVEASIHALKLRHDVLECHFARRRGGSIYGWSKRSGMSCYT